MPGRNLDYGKFPSSTNEGEIARKTLLSMARDLYNLYTTLNDDDDLPQWCHYKIAKSEENLRTVTDYLVNKINKHCLDNNKNFDDVRLAINKSVKNSFINDGLW